MKQAATWPKHSILQIPKLGYQSMYSYSLATTVCCTRQSAFLLNQSNMKINSGLLADLRALHKTEEKLKLLTLRKFKFA